MIIEGIIEIRKNNKIFLLNSQFYINPIEPAVNPTAKKNVNSNRSLGREFTNKFI